MKEDNGKKTGSNHKTEHVTRTHELKHLKTTTTIIPWLKSGPGRSIGYVKIPIFQTRLIVH